MNKEQIINKLKENWHIFAVIGVFLFAFKIRLLSLPLVKTYLPDIDTYFFYRGSTYLLNNNFHFPVIDVLRNYPFGLDFYTEMPLAHYLPAIWYKIMSIFINQDYWTLVRYYAPMISSLAIFPMYLIGKELKDKWAGIFSAFFFAVMPAILMRNPAGYIEKEPATIAFMIFSTYFFIRTLKKNSWLSASLMGGFLALVDIGWGGVDLLYLGYSVFAVIMLLANKYNTALIKNYAFMALAILSGAFIERSSYFGTDHLMVYITFSLILLRYAAERLNLIKKDSLKYFIPALSVIGLMFILIASSFSAFFAGVIQEAGGYLFYSENVFGGTVAEQQRPDFGSFLGQFGTPYASSILSFMQPILPYLSAWIFAYVALVYLSYKSEYRWISLAASSIAVISFLMFVNSPGSNLQIIYLVSFFTSVFFLARNDDFTPALIATLLFASMLGFMRYVRVGFLIGPYLSIFAGYFIADMISRIRNNSAVKNAATLEEKINIYSIGGSVLIALILVANLATGYAIGSSMGPNYNDNWNGAMNFMKNETPKESVIVSWWDFGYWFQAMGERATSLDGGNNYIHGDKLAGMYFSGRMNKTEEKDYLNRYGITHILVDYSMIGKYAAMTRIGTDWKEIDQYIPLGNPQQAQRNGKTILIFQLGSSAFYVPIAQNGSGTSIAKTQDGGDITVDGGIIFSQPSGDVNLKYLCTENGLLDLKPKEPSWDACLLITPYGWFFPVDASNGKPSTLTGTSTFAKLFFFNGKGVDYVKKVYDNPEIKIYEVELPRKTREELFTYWAAHSNDDGGFAGMRLQSLKSHSLCAKGNTIEKC